MDVLDVSNLSYETESTRRTYSSRLISTARYYTTDISEQIVRDVADVMVSGGYRDRGYEWLCIDDGWSTARDPATNALRADPLKFPSGITALIDYVHQKGLKFGIYADVGSATCGGYSGLDMDKDLKNRQYVEDVETFASWGVDALKVDGCYQDPAIMSCVRRTRPPIARTGTCVSFARDFLIPPAHPTPPPTPIPFCRHHIPGAL